MTLDCQITQVRYLHKFLLAFPLAKPKAEERSKLRNALPLSEYLPDGRVRDTITSKINHNNESSVYCIITLDNEELLVKSLKEAASFLGIHYVTLSKKLDDLSSRTGCPTIVNNYSVKRVRVFFKDID